MRVGILGGSYNPIHFGHLRAAEEVREAIALDLVYFVPAASPPHKPEGELAPAEHRLQMARLATKGNRHFMVSDFEVRHGGRSYTIETVRFFLSTLRQPATLYLMMGGDQFADFHTWREAAAIAASVNIAVHTRLTDQSTDPARKSVAAISTFGYTRDDDHYVHPNGHTLSFVETSFFPISASSIRRKLQRGASINYLVPHDVGDYIQRHQLY